MSRPGGTWGSAEKNITFAKETVHMTQNNPIGPGKVRLSVGKFERFESNELTQIVLQFQFPYEM